MKGIFLAAATAAAVLASALTPASAHTASNALLNGTASQALAVNGLAVDGAGQTSIEATGQSVAFHFVTKVNKPSSTLNRTR